MRANSDNVCAYVVVLILIILEVLYESGKTYKIEKECYNGLNPYYTGSTLWDNKINKVSAKKATS